MTAIRALVALGAAVLTMTVSVPAWAEAEGPAKPAKRVPGSKKVLKLDELHVQGKIQKPQTMFLMPRANLNVGEIERAEPVLPKVSEAVERAPF